MKENFIRKLVTLIHNFAKFIYNLTSLFVGDEDMENKRLRGQYFTITNPFDTVGFYKWMERIPNLNKETILEPFAGSNNIPAMLSEDNILNNKWKCFDVEPSQENKCPSFNVNEQDTIKNFPNGFKITITNPPYLSKNSATRRGLDFPNTQYDDLYKLCLEKMLDNCDFVAAIIPETFITSGLFHNRLFAVISLTCKMFDDTECPVCLALFIPEHNDSFLIYRMNELIGSYDELIKNDVKCDIKNKWIFNDPNGEIGIWCIDGTKAPTIRFGKGVDIPANKIKISSRSLTRVSGLPTEIKIEELINECNKILENYRKTTKDVFLASFKGLRNDGFYRRRLDFATARNILNLAVVNVRGSEND